MNQRHLSLTILVLAVAATALIAAAAPPAASAAASGTRLWAKTIPQVITAHADHVLFVKPGPQGSVYVGGVYLEPLFSGYLFVARYTSSGKQLWLRKYGKAQHIDANANAIAVDAKGNLIVAGQSAHGLDERALVLKYSPAGKLLWHHEFNGPVADGWDSGSCVTTDVFGNILIGGTTTKAVTGEDYLVVKYSAAGHRSWVFTASGGGSAPHNGDVVNAITTDPRRNVYLTGASDNAAGDTDCVTIKLTPTGHDAWTPFSRTLTGSGSGNDWGVRIAVLKGKVRVLASLYDGANGDDVGLVTYTAGGVGSSPSVTDFGGRDDTSMDLAVDASGAAWVCGYTAGSSLSVTAFVIRYDPSGAVVGTPAYAPAGANDTSFAQLAVDGKGSAWAVGNEDTLATAEKLVLVKYHGAAGAQVWARSYAGSQHAASGECITLAGATPSVFVGGWQIRPTPKSLDPLLAKYVK